ncbi:hypothetical protein GW17_00000474 [Ensete ventricosum]|nr:hypothetical protein GW17_00000474 [Ensete ventricosum]
MTQVDTPVLTCRAIPAMRTRMSVVRRLATEFIPLAISMRLLIHRRSHLHAAARRVSELLRLGNPDGCSGKKEGGGVARDEGLCDSPDSRHVFAIGVLE